MKRTHARTMEPAKTVRGHTSVTVQEDLLVMIAAEVRLLGYITVI